MSGPTEDQFAGCLVGQCLGDALGFVVEGRSRDVCEGYVLKTLKGGGAGTLGRPPYRFGQYTDDSQLARELLESYVEAGRFDPADYARRIAAIFADNRIVGHGRTTEAAARRLAAGMPWTEAGEPAPNAGNGSAMRAAPIGLMFWDDTEGLIAAAHDQGRITHADPRCSAGAIAIAGAVGLALSGNIGDPEAVIDTLAEWSTRADSSFAGELRKLGGWLALDPDDAGPVIAQAGLQPGHPHWDGISPFVTSSVLWSLYSFLRTPDSYWETICTAIAVGGDVDTTAAMAGAISGALGGLSAVPAALAERLNDQRRWGYHALLELAARAHALKSGP